MKVRNIMLMAKAVSLVSSPFYLSVVGLVMLFTFSYLNQMPLVFKLIVVLMTYALTVIMPKALISVYHSYHGWSLFELGQRERRMIPYIVSIICYFACYYVMTFFHVPHLMGSIVVAALMVQIACAVVNMWWKISVHMAAIGAMTGGLVAFSAKFMFNPVWWLCALFLLAGLVGSARLTLRQHTLRQLNVGYIVGLTAGFLTITFF